ncbi:hypothetical protein Pfo_008257, partial [Paulownia fortunei]
QRTKFTPRARVSVFLGYPFGYKGYKLLDLENNQIYISRHVFHESLFPFANSDIAAEALDVFSDGVLPKPIYYESDSFSSQNQSNTSSISHGSQIPPSTSIQSSIRPTRVTKRPASLSDYHCYLVNHFSSSSLIPSSNSTLYPISSFLSYQKFSPSYRSFVLSITSEVEPQFFSQAIGSPEWHDAM